MRNSSNLTKLTIQKKAVWGRSVPVGSSSQFAGTALSRSVARR